MTKKRQQRHDVTEALSPAQREIMEVIWEHGESSASRVREILSADRDVARNTVRTLMERMEAKGWLTHRVDGRTYLYSAAVPRKASIGQKVAQIVDELCGGQPDQLVNALLDYRGVNASELRKIQKLLDDAKTVSKDSKRKG